MDTVVTSTETSPSKADVVSRAFEGTRRRLAWEVDRSKIGIADVIYPDPFRAEVNAKLLEELDELKPRLAGLQEAVEGGESDVFLASIQMTDTQAVLASAILYGEMTQIRRNAKLDLIKDSELAQEADITDVWKISSCWKALESRIKPLLNDVVFSLSPSEAEQSAIVNGVYPLTQLTGQSMDSLNSSRRSNKSDRDFTPEYSRAIAKFWAMHSAASLLRELPATGYLGRKVDIRLGALMSTRNTLRRKLSEEDLNEDEGELTLNEWAEVVKEISEWNEYAEWLSRFEIPATIGHLSSLFRNGEIIDPRAHERMVSHSLSLLQPEEGDLGSGEQDEVRSSLVSQLTTIRDSIAQSSLANTGVTDQSTVEQA